MTDQTKGTALFIALMTHQPCSATELALALQLQPGMASVLKTNLARLRDGGWVLRDPDGFYVLNAEAYARTGVASALGLLAQALVQVVAQLPALVQAFAAAMRADHCAACGEVWDA